MACQANAGQVTRAAVRNGIADGQSGYVAGQRDDAGLYLPGGKLPWPPPGGAGRGLWRDYQKIIKTSLAYWRSRRDDLFLGRVRTELAADLAERAAAGSKNDGLAGVGTPLAEERAALLLAPPKSVTAAERVERVAVLDNALALLRLKQVISAAQYRAALVDMVGPARVRRSAAPVTWRPARPVGIEEETASQVDPTRKINTRYRLVDLDEPLASNTLTGAVNPAYDPDLQPRQRARAASRAQIDRLAQQLAPDALLKSGASWADGPPLVGPDGLVESGNGRLLALRRAVEINPAGYAAYRQALLNRTAEFGLARNEAAKMKRPVLVRERLTTMTADERRRFVAEANASGASRMGAAEQARADASLIPPGFFAALQVADKDDSLAAALAKKANAPVASRFFSLLPETERAALMDSRGGLSAEGVNRLERAMFAYAMPGPAGERLARLVFEEGEAIDRVGAGVRQALPQLGQLEDAIRAGQRDANLSLGADVAAAVEKLRDLRRQGLSVNDYLRQTSLFEELTPVQKQLLAQLDGRRRSARAVAGLLNAYTAAALKTPPPGQGRLYDGPVVSREELLRAAVRAVGETWVEPGNWSGAQRAISGLDIPAPRVQRLKPARQARAMQLANTIPARPEPL